MTKGYLALILHAHLPYVRHPEHDEFLEEHWFFEAITETYIPLIQVFDQLLQDRVPFRISMAVSPSLANMLADPLLMQRYERRLNRLIELAGREVERTAWQPEFNRLALHYHWLFSRVRETFVDRCRRDLRFALRQIADTGALELMTCAATHGYLPLMNANRPAMRAQIQLAASEHERHFGRRPRGIWLPECAYEPGVDTLLAEAGIQFFVVDTHGLLHATPRPKYGIFAPIVCPSGVVAFGRDLESSKQVWSAKEGYPGDPIYRDFYRDIGWDLDYDYVAPYLPGDKQRTSIGIKYHRITGRTDHKEVYDPDRARRLAAEHAGHFMFDRERQVEHLRGLMDQEPIVVAPYDAELFGHWWHEGPQFLDFLLRKIAFDQESLETTTPIEYLERHPRIQEATPSTSSWGYLGFHEYWLNGDNDWVYPHLHRAAERMVNLAERYQYLGGEEGAGVPPLRVRALNQAARELLLAQHSDWAFIMKTGAMVEYANRRTWAHLSRFRRLAQDLEADRIDPAWLAEVESRDNIFPRIDYRIYSP
jgi:1,4-alpha-glucan branching enzyme